MKDHMKLSSMDRRTVVRIGIALGSTLLWSCSPDKHKFNSVNLTGADFARDFSLKDHNGQLRSLKDFKGKILAVFFGFTHCPDVCPTSMAEMAEVKRLLGADGDKLQVAFITVDPQRDTPEVMKAYMANFDGSFLALCPTEEELAMVAKEFKIYYRKVEGRTPTSYTMDHSAGTYVFDTQGRIRLYGRYGEGPKPLAEDIRRLLNES